MADGAEHLALCKERALAHLDRFELLEAVETFFQDRKLHPAAQWGYVAEFADGVLVVQEASRKLRRLIEGARLEPRQRARSGTGAG